MVNEKLFEMVYKNDVIVCDDDFAIVDVLDTILLSYEIPVRAITESRYLLTTIMAECPKLLIIDLWMPVVSGDQIIYELRGDPAFNDLIILCMSASIDGREIAMQAGADAFLAKPFDMKSLMNIVNEVMK